MWNIAADCYCILFRFSQKCIPNIGVKKLWFLPWNSYTFFSVFLLFPGDDIWGVFYVCTVENLFGNVSIRRELSHENPNSVLCVCFTHSRNESCVLFAQLFWLTSAVCCFFFGKRWQYRPWRDLSKLRFSSILLLDRSNVRNCVAIGPDQEINFCGLIFIRTTVFDCLSVGGRSFDWIDQIWVA